MRRKIGRNLLKYQGQREKRPGQMSPIHEKINDLLAMSVKLFGPRKYS